MTRKRAFSARAVDTPGRLTIARTNRQDSRNYFEIEQMLLLAAVAIMTRVTGRIPAAAPGHVRAVQVPVS